METFIILIILIFGILQLILFFKIWGMTNDIREIKERYLSSTTSPKKKQMRIKEITEDGKYSCYTGGGASHEGDFTASEIKRFNS